MYISNGLTFKGTFFKKLNENVIFKYRIVLLYTFTDSSFEVASLKKNMKNAHMETTEV